jgi:small subunit ribosomal protein S16
MVVADSRNRRDGRFIERIGFYNPIAAENENGLVVNTERLAFWQGHGAQLSPTAARLVKQAAVAKAA